MPKPRRFCVSALSEPVSCCLGLPLTSWGKYRWNYERISASEHVAFARRMVDEYRASQDANELDYSLFKPEDAALLRNLLDVGAEAFAAAHPDSY